MEVPVREVLEGQIVVVVLSDGTKTQAMIREKYPLDMDDPDGDYALLLTGLGNMYFGADERVTVVEWS